jgi:hypothetical protein
MDMPTFLVFYKHIYPPLYHDKILFARFMGMTAPLYPGFSPRQEKNPVWKKW